MPTPAWRPMTVSRSSSEKRVPGAGPRSINKLAMRWLYWTLRRATRERAPHDGAPGQLSLLRPHRQQIRDHIGQLLSVELHLQTLRHQRLGGRLDRFDLTAQEGVFHLLGAAEGDARRGLG